MESNLVALPFSLATLAPCALRVGGIDQRYPQRIWEPKMWFQSKYSNKKRNPSYCDWFIARMHQSESGHRTSPLKNNPLSARDHRYSDPTMQRHRASCPIESEQHSIWTRPNVLMFKVCIPTILHAWHQTKTRALSCLRHATSYFSNSRECIRRREGPLAGSQVITWRINCTFTCFRVQPSFSICARPHCILFG